MENVAIFTITVGPERTSVHTLAQTDNPENALDLAIAALEAERSALRGCPYHAEQAAIRALKGQQP